MSEHPVPASELAFFKHHPDSSIDFCIEVEAIEGMARDACIGIGSEVLFWGHLSRALGWCRLTDMPDDYAVRARDDLRAFEGRFHAGDFCPRPSNA